MCQLENKIYIYMIVRGKTTLKHPMSTLTANCIPIFFAASYSLSILFYLHPIIKLVIFYNVQYMNCYYKPTIVTIGAGNYY